MNTRTCTKCGETKPATTEFFYKKKRDNGYGLESRCRDCKSIYARSKNNPPNTDPSITKVCPRCSRELPATLDYFYKSKGEQYGIHSLCIECTSIRNKSIKNPPNTDTSITQACTECNRDLPATTDFFAKKAMAKYGVSERCKRCTAEKRGSIHNITNDNPLLTKTCHKCNRDLPATIEYFHRAKREKYGVTDSCKHCKGKYSKEYVRRPEVRLKQNQRERERRRTDPCFRITRNLRNKVRSSVKNKSDNSLSLLGCPIQDFIFFIEYQWDGKMSWDNYGVYWEIDHIIPVNNYNMELEEDQRRAFNWMNCRPLTKSENMSRSKQIDYSLVTILKLHKLLPTESYNG